MKKHTHNGDGGKKTVLMASNRFSALAWRSISAACRSRKRNVNSSALKLSACARCSNSAVSSVTRPMRLANVFKLGTTVSEWVSELEWKDMMCVRNYEATLTTLVAKWDGGKMIFVISSQRSWNCSKARAVCSPSDLPVMFYTHRCQWFG